MIEFFATSEPIDTDLFLLYEKDEYSLKVQSAGNSSDSHILVNYLDLEINQDGYVVSLHGYCPLAEAEDVLYEPKNYVVGRLMTLAGPELQRGFSYRYNDINVWKTSINRKSGWICIGDPAIDSKQSVEFIPGCVAILDGLRLVALWFHPIIEGKNSLPIGGKTEIKFIPIDKKIKNDCSLIYKEGCFLFEPKEVGCGTSVSIDRIELQVDGDWNIVCLDGFCPLIQAQETSNEPKNYQSRCLKVLSDPELKHGFSYGYNDLIKWWPLHINRKSGWICIGNPTIENRVLIEFAPSCIGALQGTELTALWLHPKFQ